MAKEVFAKMGDIGLAALLIVIATLAGVALVGFAVRHAGDSSYKRFQERLRKEQALEDAEKSGDNGPTAAADDLINVPISECVDPEPDFVDPSIPRTIDDDGSTHNVH